MPFNLEWIWWIAQIVIDIILLAAVFILLGKLKKPRANGQLPLAADDFVEQAGHLAREFDRLLGEKRELVNTTLATLDTRIGELRAMLEQAHSLKEQIQSQPPARTKFNAAKAQEKFAAARGNSFAVPEEDSFQLPPGHPLNQIKEEAASNGEQEFRAQVLQMLGQGRAPQEIANATGRPRAEVELLIALIK